MVKVKFLFEVTETICDALKLPSGEDVKKQSVQYLENWKSDFLRFCWYSFFSLSEANPRQNLKKNVEQSNFSPKSSVSQLFYCAKKNPPPDLGQKQGFKLLTFFTCFLSHVFCVCYNWNALIWVKSNRFFMHGTDGNFCSLPYV